MAKDYLYDVFVSYRHERPVQDWVTNHFYPLLEQWLPGFMPYGPEIFIDWSIETGSAWPAKLRQALQSSRCLLAVWSPEYFRSRWCLAEWRSMFEREQLLRLRTTRKPSGLIYPVVFVDGEHFPQDALDTQSKDLRKWNTPHPVFRETREFVEFDREMQQLCEELARMILRAPAWKNNWPIASPRIPRKVPVKLPRFK